MRTFAAMLAAGLLLLTTPAHAFLNHVANNTELSALKAKVYPYVMRDGYAAAGDAPPLMFVPLTGNCAANSLVDDGGSCVNAAGGGSWKAIHPATGIDPVQFGAPTNNTGDASIGINAAIQFVRNQQTSGLFTYSLDLGGSGRNYKLVNPINLTCINDRSSGASGCPIPVSPNPFVVHSDGAMISCNTTNRKCIDGQGSQFIWLSGSGLTLAGACDATEPSYGLAHGRARTGVSASDWRVSHLFVTGCFKQAAYYNGGSEESTVQESTILNNDASGGYGIAIDGSNHFNVTSTFVTTNLVADTPDSLDDMYIGKGTVGAAGPSSLSNAIFISGTNGLQLDGTFLRSNNDACITLYHVDAANAASSTHYLKAKAHCETDKTHIAAFISIQSKNAASAFVLDHLELTEYDTDVTTSLFATDANTTSVAMDNERVSVTWYGTLGAAPSVFDNGSKYTITNPERDFFTANITGWNPVINGCTASSGNGLGVGGTCALLTGATPSAGVIRLTAGTSPAGFGNMVLNFPSNLGQNSSNCIFDPITNGLGAFWTAPGAYAYKVGGTIQSPTFQWQNGGLTALTAGGSYDMYYNCKGL